MRMRTHLGENPPTDQPEWVRLKMGCQKIHGIKTLRMWLQVGVLRFFSFDSEEVWLFVCICFIANCWVFSNLNHKINWWDCFAWIFFAKILKTTPCRQEDYLTGTDCVTLLWTVETLGNCWWPGLNLNVFIRFRLEPISSFREMGKGVSCETIYSLSVKH